MPRELTLTIDSSWPIIVYYQFWTGSGYGLQARDITSGERTALSAQDGNYVDCSVATDKVSKFSFTGPSLSLLQEQIVAVRIVAYIKQSGTKLFYGSARNASSWTSGGAFGSGDWAYRVVRIPFDQSKPIYVENGAPRLYADLDGVWSTPTGEQRLIDHVYFVVEYEVPPNAPTLTSPAGTVWTLSPTFQGTYSQPDGVPIAGVQVEVQTSGGSAVWSTTVTSGLSGSSWAVPYGGPALTSGTQYRWRARTACQGAGLIWGPWSGWQTFTPVQNAPPSATPTSPTGGAAVGTLTPTLQWSYSDPNGHAQAAYQVQVRRQSDGATMWDTGTVASGAQSVVYGGTGLQNGTVYEWRVRVYDGWDWSSFSAWAAFQPLIAPDPPTLTSPSGVIDTLQPLIAGTYNRATGGPEGGWQYQLRSNGVTIYDSGAITGAIASGQTYGTDNPSDTPSTPPALQWGTDYEVRARSRDTSGAWSAWSAWVPFRTQSAPLTPTGLQPPDGAWTTDTTPVLQWTHVDPDGDPQTAAEIAIEEDATGQAVTGYPRQVTGAAGSHEVVTALTATPPTRYRWRVRTLATPGVGWGAWSSWRILWVTTELTVAIASPPDGSTVTAPGPVVQWAIAGGSGQQATWRVRVYEGGQLIHDSGAQSGAATTYALPTTLLRTGHDYVVRVEVTDTAGYAASAESAISCAWTPPPTIAGLKAVPVGSQEVV